VTEPTPLINLFHILRCDIYYPCFLEQFESSVLVVLRNRGSPHPYYWAFFSVFFLLLSVVFFPRSVVGVVWKVIRCPERK